MMKRRMLNIGVDIDSTINKAHYYDIIHGRKLCEEYGYHPDEKLDRCSVKEMFDLPQELYDEYMRRYFHWNVKNNEVKEGAAEALRFLHKMGHKIIIITARDDTYNKPNQPYTGDMMKQDTINWLNEHDIPYDDIIFNARDKAEVCAENRISVMIDDDPKHIISCSEKTTVIIAGESYNEYLIDHPNTLYSRNWIETVGLIETILRNVPDYQQRLCVALYSEKGRNGIRWRPLV